MDSKYTTCRKVAPEHLGQLEKDLSFVEGRMREIRDREMPNYEIGDGEIFTPRGSFMTLEGKPLPFTDVRGFYQHYREVHRVLTLAKEGKLTPLDIPTEIDTQIKPQGMRGMWSTTDNWPVYIRELVWSDVEELNLMALRIHAPNCQLLEK